MDERTEQEKRDDYCRGLRAIASFLEENSKAPLPTTTSLGFYTNLKEVVADAARTPGKWEKSYTSWSFVLTQEFHGITLSYQCDRATVCERKIVGTKRVEAYFSPAHDEDIVEWECNDPLLKPPAEE